jgi:propanediol dehydratase large subunit
LQDIIRMSPDLISEVISQKAAVKMIICLLTLRARERARILGSVSRFAR